VDLSKPIVSDADTAFYILDGETGVWVFPTVLPTDLSNRGIALWLSTIVYGLLALEAAGVKNLVIDVSRNGGGIVCAGYALVDYLFPNTTFVEYDVRETASLGYLMRNADVRTRRVPASDFQSIFSTVDLESVDGSKSIFEPGRTFVRGGVNGTYSNQFRFGACGEFTRDFLGNVPRLERGWDPRRVFVVGGGVGVGR
ncbi:hypothetical protein HDU67_005355, partial [Dinochytrium kinnereticum]